MALGYAGCHNINPGLLANQKMSYEKFAAKMDDYRKTHANGGSEADGLAMVREDFGLGDSSHGLGLSPAEEAQLREAFRASMNGGKPSSSQNPDDFRLLYGGYDPLAVTACRILDNKAGIAYATHYHSACPVPVRAIGPGSELFAGYIDNTDIANNLFTLLGAKQTAVAK
jgi:alkaline phosphatase